MKKLVEQIKDVLTQKKIKEWEIFLERTLEHSVESRDGLADANETTESFGYGIRLWRDGKVGFSYSSDMSGMAISQVIDWAEASCDASMQDILQGPSENWASHTRQFSAYDTSISQIKFEDRFEKAKLMEDTALAADPRVTKVRYCLFADTLTERLIAASNKLDLQEATTRFSITVAPLAEKGDQSEMVYDGFSSPFLKDLPFKEIASRASMKAAALLGGERIPNFRGPAVMDAAVMTELMELIAPSATAESVHKKNSYFIDKSGQSIYSPQVTLIDDGLHPTADAGRGFDDEGVASQTKTVIDKGVLKQLLYDSYWARRDGVRSTGNAFREEPISYPKLSPSNFYLQPGHPSLEQLFVHMGSGLYITELIGMHMADPVSGDLSVGAQGFVVQSGKIIKPFRSVALTGNLHDFLKRVITVGSDMRWNGNFGSPSALVEEVDVSGSSD